MTPPPTQGYSAAELELADRARTGDQRAMTRLYDRYAPRLYHHAVRMLGDEAAARDAVQEAFTRALSAIGRTREELRFRAWIYRIVTNLCLRQLNQRQRWSGREVPESVDHAGGTPEKDLRRAEAAALVMEALDELPPRYRQILVLRELDELSYEDLARVLESDVSRVRVTLHRARARLAALFIARQLQDDPPTSVQCQGLEKLLARPAERKPLVKHLEGCPRCRQRRHRPAVELLGLLPAVEAPAMTPPSELTTAPASSATLPLVVKALAPLVVGGLGLVLGTLAVTSSDPLDPKVLRQPTKVASGSVSAGTSGSGLQAPGFRKKAAGLWPKAAEPPSPAMVAAVGANTPRPSPRKPARTAPRKTATGTTGKHAPLAIKLQFAPGSLKVQRGAQPFVPRGPEDLKLGDLLEGKPGTSFGLWLPRKQWLIVQGSVRLDAVPFKKARPGKIAVSLIRGQVRARATSLGGGIAVSAGASICQASGGKFRVRLTPASVRVESTDAYVSVNGPHAARTVPPATGLDLGRRPGFAHRLLPAPLGLRPVQACARRPPPLSWKRAPGARAYRLQLATDTDFRDLRADLTVSGVSATPGALEDGKYFWRVLAQDGNRRGLPSKIYGFTVSGACP